MITSNSRRIFFISYYIISVMLVFIFLGNVKWLTYARLMINGTATNGVVTTIACSNGMSFAYRFNVEGKGFVGSGEDGYGNPPCSSLKTGDSAMLVYLTSDPRTNVPGDPAARLISEFAAIALVAFFLPILMLLLFFGLSKAWRKKNTG